MRLRRIGPWLAQLAVATALLLAGATAPAQQSFLARVVQVDDGDSITVVRGRQQVRIRLDGIDCPEVGQDFGRRARQFTARWIGKTVSVEPREADEYGRLVARVRAQGEDLSIELVKAGLAWHYRRYSSDSALARAEREARDARLGLWGQPNPIPPWDYRHRSRQAPRPATGGTYHGNVRSLVFHALGCPHYNCANCRRVFASVAEAKAAGFRPHTACVE
jgi:micrococcal nuclease